MNKTTINILKKEINFIDLIYYDGVKLQIDLNEYNILVWYDYQDINNEEWFLVKSNEKKFKQYISNKISLLDVFEGSEVYTFERNYQNYETIKEIIKIQTFENYELPDDDAYLGFNFTEESEYLSHLFSTYKKSDKKKYQYVSKRKQQKKSKIEYRYGYGNEVEWRINVAA